MATDPDDDTEATVPGVPRPAEPEQELDWPPEPPPASPPNPADFGGVAQTDLEAGTLRRSEPEVTPAGGLVTLAILLVMTMGVIFAAFNSLIWELAALALMICIPAAAAVAILAWRASSQKKQETKTPTTASAGK